jgi:beta-galactosidase
MVTRDMADRLSRFVKAGGVLVLTAQAGLKDFNCHVVEKPLPGLLTKLAGLLVEDWSAVKKGESFTARLADGQTLSLNTFVERLKLKTARALACWAGGDGLLGNAPAIAVNRLGRGFVYYIGGYCPPAAQAALVGLICARHDIAPPVQTSAEVECIIRQAGRKRYLALLNHSSVSQSVAGLPEKVKNLMGPDQPKDGQMVLPPFGVVLLR